MDPATPDEALGLLLEEGAVRARSLGSAHARLWQCLTDATEGGKRFRPMLVTATYEALGGTDRRAVATLGAAVELLHTAFVVHDDVIDGDEVRRGRPNVNGTVTADARAGGADAGRATHLGRTAGILAGDLALAGAIRAVATCCRCTDTIRRLLDLFDRALHTTAAGELSDVRLGLGLEPPALATVLTMEERKTSAYSFELPLQSGAVLAGAAEPLVEGLGAAGRLLGIAFQLADDIDGTFGDPAQTGKSALSDLREGKQTPLIAHARGSEGWQHIAGYVGRADLTEDDAEEVRRLLTAVGSRRFVEDLATDYAATALDALTDLGLPPGLVTTVSTLTDGFARRAA